MRRLSIFACAALLVVGLASCAHKNTDGSVTTGFPGFASNVIGMLGGGAVGAWETNTVAGAGEAATALFKVANAYQISDACDKECSAKITEYTEAIRKPLNEAFDANRRGDSGAVKLALDAFNIWFPKLRTYLNERGVATPAPHSS